MATRSSVSAALALAAATIVLAAACGSQVAGVPAPNPAAVASAVVSEIPSQATDLTLTSWTTELSMTADFDITTDVTSLSELPELSALLTELPTDLTDDLTELGIPTDLSIPTELSEVLNFSEPCIAITFALAGIGFATLSAYLGGSDAFDSAALTQSVEELAAAAPPELAADVQALREVAASTAGQTLSEVGAILSGEKYTVATDNITAWTEATCSG